MKFTKSLLAAAVMMVGTSALAAPQVKSVVLGDAEKGIFFSWSSVCVANTDLKTDVAIQYRYGQDGTWSDYKVEANTITVFQQRFRNNDEPLPLTVKFNATATGPELSYTLDEQETRWRTSDCADLVNYKFAATDAGNGAIDLIKVQ
jgi:hypothetical protein